MDFGSFMNNDIIYFSDICHCTSLVHWDAKNLELRKCKVVILNNINLPNKHTLVAYVE